MRRGVLRVTRIAQTHINAEAMVEATNYRFDPREEGVKDPDLLTEFAGRACYQSWSRPNPETRRNADYISSTVATKGHESITAHASVTYYVTGISRALTHELLRHRWLAFSELSQRYVPAGQLDWVIPPAMDGFGDLEDMLTDAFYLASEAYEVAVERLKEEGFSGKRAREAARAFLPNFTETRIVVTGNLRAWRDFIRQRWSVHADAEIRELAEAILLDLKEYAPAVFADIPDQPYGSEAA